MGKTIFLHKSIRVEGQWVNCLLLQRNYLFSPSFLSFTSLLSWDSEQKNTFFFLVFKLNTDSCEKTSVKLQVAM